MTSNESFFFQKKNFEEEKNIVERVKIYGHLINFKFKFRRWNILLSSILEFLGILFIDYKLFEEYQNYRNFNIILIHYHLYIIYMKNIL